MKKNLSMVSAVLLVTALFSFLFYNKLGSTLGMVSFIVSLALSIYTFFQKYEGTESARLKIAKKWGRWFSCL